MATTRSVQIPATLNLTPCHLKIMITRAKGRMCRASPVLIFNEVFQHFLANCTSKYSPFSFLFYVQCHLYFGPVNDPQPTQKKNLYEGRNSPWCSVVVTHFIYVMAADIFDPAYELVYSKEPIPFHLHL